MPEQNTGKNPSGQTPKKNFGTDQRYFPRWEVNNRVVCHWESLPSPVEARSRDINSTGACIYIQEPLKPKQKLQLTIYLSGRKSIQVQGVVVWNRSQDDQFMVGICFSNTPQEAQDLILKYAFEFKKEDLMKQWYKGWD